MVSFVQQPVLCLISTAVSHSHCRFCQTVNARSLNSHWSLHIATVVEKFNCTSLSSLGTGKIQHIE